MSAARRLDSTARRAGRLAGSLACVLASAALYAHQVGFAVKQHPSDSHGSPTLAVAAAFGKPKARENAGGGVKAPPRARMATAWTSPWGWKG